MDVLPHVHETKCLWANRSWGEMSIHGAKRPWGKLSVVREVLTPLPTPTAVCCTSWTGQQLVYQLSYAQSWWSVTVTIYVPQHMVQLTILHLLHIMAKFPEFCVFWQNLRLMGQNVYRLNALLMWLKYHKTTFSHHQCLLCCEIHGCHLCFMQVENIQHRCQWWQNRNRQVTATQMVMTANAMISFSRN